MSAATSTPGPSRDQTAFHGRAAGRATCRCSAELIADLVRAPHFDEEHLEREKKVILSEIGEMRRFARRPRLRSSVRSGVRRTRRSAARCSAARRRVRAHQPRRLPRLAERQFVPARLILVGQRQGRAGRAARPRRAAVRRHGGPARARRSSRRDFTGGVRNDRREFEQAHWCLALPGLRRRRSADARAGGVRPGARRRHVVAAVPGAARGARPGLFDRRLAPGVSPTPAWSASAARRTARARRNR